MAVKVTTEQVRALLAEQLAPRLRYRCLVLQTADLATLAQLCVAGETALRALDADVQILEYRDQLDNIGALPCSRVLDRIETLAFSKPLVIAGPLHFLDYWSRQVGAAFWDYLASFSRGPGILIVDAPREQGLDHAFRLVGRIRGTDVGYFKSRLAAAQDGLV